jgi:hypothetical protein
MVAAMARTVLRRRCDGVTEIRRLGRWAQLSAALGAAMVLLLPLVLSLTVLLPRGFLAIPPLTLAAAAWLLSRTVSA